MSKKKLQINCETCDVRGITREVLDAYESVRINTECLINNAASLSLMADYKVRINAENIINLPDGQNVANKSFNGKCRITKGMFRTPTYLIVNGRVEIDEDAFDDENRLLGITVNGVICYPDSVRGSLPPMTVNGKSVVYPADCVRLPAAAVVDKLFALRARATRYFAEKSAVVVDRSADIAKMVEKKIIIFTKKAYIAGSLLEDAVNLFDESAEIVEVSDGTVYLPDCHEISADILRRYGGRLLILGDVKLIGMSADELQQLEGLYVSGTVFADETAAERLRTIDLSPQTPIRVVKGDLIADRGEFCLTAAQLDGCESLTVVGCGTVELDAMLSADVIREKLVLYDCGMVACTPQQRAAVELAASGCGYISSVQEALSGGEDDGCNLGGSDGQDIIFINTDEYRF